MFVFRFLAKQPNKLFQTGPQQCNFRCCSFSCTNIAQTCHLRCLSNCSYGLFFLLTVGFQSLQWELCQQPITQITVLFFLYLNHTGNTNTPGNLVNEPLNYTLCLIYIPIWRVNNWFLCQGSFASENSSDFLVSTCNHQCMLVSYPFSNQMVLTTAKIRLLYLACYLLKGTKQTCALN